MDVYIHVQVSDVDVYTHTYTHCVIVGVSGVDAYTVLWVCQMCTVYSCTMLWVCPMCTVYSYIVLWVCQMCTVYSYTVLWVYQMLWTNDPILEYNPATKTTKLPSYMKARLSSSSSSTHSLKQRLSQGSQ